MAKNIYGFENKKNIKAITFIEIFVIAVCAIAIIAMLIFFVLFSKEGTAPKIFGKYIYLSNVSSMSDAIPLHSAVIANPDSVNDLAKGKVVLCNVEINDEKYITILRIQDIQQEDGSNYYILRGDSNAENETIGLSQENIIAECTGYSTFWGIILTFAGSQLGILAVVIVPCAIGIIWQVLRIIRLNKYDDDEDDDDFVDDEDDDSSNNDVVFSTLNNKHDDEREPQFSQPNPPVKKLYVGNEGKAEYNKKAAPTAGYDELHETIRNTQNPNPMRTPTDASTRLNAQRGTVSENFKPKPTARDFEAASEIHFEKSEKNYYDRPKTMENIYECPQMSSEKPADTAFQRLAPPAVENPVDITIPTDAVKPRETIAPPPKQQNNKTVEDLMKVIDQAQSGLKK